MKLLTLLFIVQSFLFAGIKLPNSFTSNFKQIVTNQKKKKIEYRGKITFSNEKFKWVYSKPTKKEVCSNQKFLTVVDHDLEQVSFYHIEKGINIRKILSKANLYKNRIYLATYEKKLYTIKLNRYNRLHSIAYFDDLDNKVQIQFLNIRYKKRYLKESKTKCNYPDYYDNVKD